jgi:hypothetical protein
MGWLQMNPQRLRVNNLFAKDDSLHVYLGLSAKPVISFEKPKEITSTLPTMSGFSSNQGFSIFLDALLNYDSLSQIINRQLVNTEFDLNKGPVKKKFIIRGCSLYGQDNEKLIIKIDFGGTNDGTFYLTGRPVYDALKKTIEVKDMDFDIKSKNMLLKTADWLFTRAIVNEISKYTRYDLTSYIDTAKANINKQLNHEWIKGVSSYGSMNDINLIGIYPKRQHLHIRSNCTGTLSVKVEAAAISL